MKQIFEYVDNLSTETIFIFVAAIIVILVLYPSKKELSDRKLHDKNK